MNSGYERSGVHGINVYLQINQIYVIESAKYRKPQAVKENLRNKEICLGSVNKERLTASGLSFKKYVSASSGITHKVINILRGVRCRSQELLQ